MANNATTAIAASNRLVWATLAWSARRKLWKPILIELKSWVKVWARIYWLRMKFTRIRIWSFSDEKQSLSAKILTARSFVKTHERKSRSKTFLVKRLSERAITFRPQKEPLLRRISNRSFLCLTFRRTKRRFSWRKTRAQASLRHNWKSNLTSADSPWAIWIKVSHQRSSTKLTKASTVFLQRPHLQSLLSREESKKNFSKTQAKKTTSRLGATKYLLKKMMKKRKPSLWIHHPRWNNAQCKPSKIKKLIS